MTRHQKTSRPRQTRVVLGFCHTGMVYTPFMISVLKWQGWELQNFGGLPAFSAQQNAIITASRNELVKGFLERKDNPEWLWVLDPDIVFQPDVFRRLLALADENTIVAAAYWNAFGDERCLTWHAQRENGLRLFKYRPNVDAGIEIGSCGMGCTLVHRHVLEVMRNALPDDPWPWFGHDLLDTSNGIEHAGEDVTFCLRARKAGFRIVGHCGVTVDHFKPHVMAHGESRSIHEQQHMRGPQAA